MTPIFARHGSGRTKGTRPAERAASVRVLSRRAILALCAFFFFFAGGCAKTAEPVDWRLGDEGQAMYYFLVQLEAAASGDTQTFEDAGQRLLKLRPSEAAYLEMADFALRRGKLEQARTTAREGLATFPASLPLTLIISDSHLQQDNPDDAASILLAYRKTYPDNQDALQELARVYLVGQRYKAFDALLRTIPSAKMTPYLHYVKARSFLGRNRLAEGEQELRLVLRQAPDMIDAWVNLGITLQMTRRHKESFAAFRKAVELDPENPGLWLRLIDAQIRANRLDLAMKSMAEGPDSPTFQLETAMLLLEAKQYARAKNLLMTVRDMPGAPEEVHIYLAAIAMENQRNATEALRELAAIPPTSPLAERALRWRLQILEETGRSAECLPLARFFAEQNPKNPALRIIHAQACALDKNLDEGIRVLRAARERWPENVAVAFHLASLLEEAHQRDEAIALMEFVLASEPRNAQALNYVGYTLAEEGKDLNRAYALLELAVAEAPEDPHIADSWAWVLYRLERYDEAWEGIRKSISLGGDHPTIWEHYGDIALKIGNPAEARKGYTNALKQEPGDAEAIQTKLRGLP